MTCGTSYARYHAQCWAANKSAEEIATELAATEHKALTHHFQWNEVGNTSDTWARADALREILAINN